MSLSLDNLSVEETEFKNGLEEAGIPVSEDEIKSAFQGFVSDSDIEHTNTSTFSPLWRLITSIAVTPFAWIVAFLIRQVMPQSYVKTATGSYLDLIAYGYGLERKQAAKAEGIITFVRDSTGQPLTVPAGTLIRTITINGTVYRMIAKSSISFDLNSTTLEVPVIAENEGAAYNLAEGYYSILETPIAGVISVYNDTNYLVAIGADVESDDDFRLRLRNQFTAVADWHTNAKYKAILTSLTGISIDNIFFDQNIPRGPGSADAYILFDAGVAAQSYIDTANDFIQDNGNHGHGDDILVKALPETQHDLVVTVHFLSTVPNSERTARLLDIEQFIRCAFRENSDYKEHLTQVTAYSRFGFSQLSQELHNFFPGLVDSFQFSIADIISSLDVPRLNTLTIQEPAP